jgi:mannose-6-phosphate isomerase-like protein (cupin superfamily)
MVKYFVEPNDVETLVMDWGDLKWMSSPRATGASKFSAGVVLLEPGKGHDTHNHPGCEEILYIISGYGRQKVADQEMELKPGMLIFIPADVDHSTFNTGWEPLKFLAIYDPPGPEEELRAAPDCTIVPAGQLP